MAEWRTKTQALADKLDCEMKQMADRLARAYAETGIVDFDRASLNVENARNGVRRHMHSKDRAATPH